MVLTNKSKTLNIPIKKTDSSYVISDSGKTELFKQHFSDIYQPHSEIFSPHTINTVEEFLNSQLSVSHLIKYFILNEMKYTIYKKLL